MRSTRHTRRLTILTATLLALGAHTASAATIICVQRPECPVGETQPTIAAAIAAAGDARARPGLDLILLGPVTFAEGDLSASSRNPIELIGAGTGATTIAPPSSSGTTLTALDDASRLMNLTLRVPDGFGTVGLVLAGTAQGVTVTASSGTEGFAVVLNGPRATFASGTVSAPTTPAMMGVLSVLPGSGTLEDADVTAGIGAHDVGTVRRVRILGTTGVSASMVAGGSTPISATVDDVLVRLAGSGPATGLKVEASGFFGDTGSASMLARHLTVIGNGDPGSVGVDVAASGATAFGGDAFASATLSGAVLERLGVALRRRAAAGANPTDDATASIAVDYSDYDPARIMSVSTDGPPGGGTAAGDVVEGSHSVDVDPGFRDAAGGDYALRADSPLVDRGDPAAPAADESPTDLAGAPRVVDGNGDGSAISDIGAFEYQPPVPPGPPTPTGGGNGGESIPPTLSALALSHARFAVARGATALAASRRHAPGAPHGTTISFRLSRAAMIALTIQRASGGRRSGGRCVKPARRPRSARRCTRYATVFVFHRTGVQGRNAVPFSGRVGRAGRTPLRRGAYRLLATATADGLAATPRSAAFTILRS